MDKPNAETRRDDLDHTTGRPRLTPRPDGGGQTDEPMADILGRGERDRMAEDSTAETAAEDGDGVPLTESQRVSRESLADLIPSPTPAPPDDDGQKTPPIAP